MSRVSSYSLVAIPLLLALTSACGGSKKPAPTPTADTADAGDDMFGDSGGVAASGDAGASGGGGSSSSAEPAAAPTLALPTGTAKIAVKGKKPATVEIKADGTVSSAGKAVGKVSGMALQSADGKPLLVGADGAVTVDGNPYGMFTGDDLTLAKGDKLAVAEDGTVTMTTGGKAAPVGKFENLGAAKRAGLLAIAFVVAPPVADKPALAGKPAPGAKGGKGGKPRPTRP